jgi:hypothetical protein
LETDEKKKQGRLEGKTGQRPAQDSKKQGFTVKNEKINTRIFKELSPILDGPPSCLY